MNIMKKIFMIIGYVLLLLILMLTSTVFFNLYYFDANRYFVTSKDSIGYYQIYDLFEDDQLLCYFQKKTYRDKLQGFVEELSYNQDFCYMEIIRQPLLLNNPDTIKNSNFLYEMHSDNITSDKKNDNVAIKSVQISKNVFDKFAINVSRGHLIIR